MTANSEITIKEGNYYPLGATVAPNGVNFSIYSKNALSVELLLFNSVSDIEPSYKIVMENHTRYIWHCFIEGLKGGQLYVYKVKGEYKPEDGLRFNPNRTLVDPYAKAISGNFEPGFCHKGYDPESSNKDLSFSTRDNGRGAPKCIVIDDAFDWGDDHSPLVSMHEMVIYETHIKGFTAHKSSLVKHPGTYLGLIEKIPYLKKLGITSVELLPVQHCQDEDFLIEKGFTNYWGYNTLGFFAPDIRFSTKSYLGCQVNEFKQMVKELHKAGIEVILDVVYNHTCEGNQLGPTYSFRGIDNPTYYRLAQNKRLYVDYTGCGNTLNLDDITVLKLVMDSLRYWIEVMHVDGFRFDLASALAREKGNFDTAANFFAAIHQDPVLCHVKLIAEPWDIGGDSSAYQVGNFPVDWAEWNGKYRDCVRKFVKGDSDILSELCKRIAGSFDLYGDNGRTPYHSINFITSHDGFTLWDLVSYYQKHNEANLENNRDGTDYNLSWNWGTEGETSDLKILKLRKKQVKNFFTILLLSLGVPMILAGDEILRTQKGNNNAYCQDNEISHIDWRLLEKNKDIFEFVKKLINLRKIYPHLRRKGFFTGQYADIGHLKDIYWYDENLEFPKWNDPETRSLGYLVKGCELEGANEFEKSIDIMVIFNAHWEYKFFRLPCPVKKEKWMRLFDTSFPDGQDIMEPKNLNPLTCQDGYLLNPRSSVVIVRKIEL